MDEITSNRGLDPGAGDSSAESGRLRPTTRLRLRLAGRSSARWPAGFVLAVVAVLAVSGLALGAQILPVLQAGSPSNAVADDPSSGPTSVLVGDVEDPTAVADPTDTPAPVPTEAPTVVATPVTTTHPASHPTLPPSGYLSFSVQAEGDCTRLYWAPFDDSSRAYYRIVRSTDSSVEWPLGANDTLAASIRDASQVTALDCPDAGTYTYRLFADEATSSGYVVLVSTHSQTITLSGSVATPRPTSAPTHAPAPTPAASPVAVDMGPLNVTANTNGTYTLTWNAYAGPLNIYSYVLCYTTNENAKFGYVEGFGGTIGVSKTATSWTGNFPWAATLRVKIEALYVPTSGPAQKAGETQVVVIPYTGATPTPAPTHTPTPTAPPLVNLGDFVTVVDNHNGTFTFSWTAYTGPLSVAYLISGTTTASGSFGYIEDTNYWSDTNVYDQTWTGPITPGSWRIKVEAVSTSTGSVIKAAETNVATVVTTVASPSPSTQP